MTLHERMKVLRFTEPESLAVAAAERWLVLLKKRTRAGIYTAALSGGRIAKLFFAAITRLGHQNPGLLDPVHLFWADERCVAPNDPASNFALAYELMLKPLGIQGDHVHRIKGELEPRQACRLAERELRLTTSCAAPQQPVLDMVFLGMGEDGHIASIFPGDNSAAVSQTVFLPVVGPKPPPNRITINYATINSAQEVWVLISGKGKEEALRRAVAGLPTPLAFVLQGRSRTLIFNDIGF